jgi:hypothetical protein
VHGGRDWIVRFNRFEGIYCRTGLAEHAVHFWLGSRDTLVENNTILNCARGIGFGLGPVGQGRRYADEPSSADGYTGHWGGLIRNNVIYADVREYDTGIGLEQARDVRVFHNTVFATGSATGAFSSIDARFANTRTEIRNNLVNNITQRAGPVVTASHNVVGVTADAFVDAAGRDLHLRADFAMAIDRGMPLDAGGLDMDGQTRGAQPDIGADERDQWIDGIRPMTIRRRGARGVGRTSGSNPFRRAQLISAVALADCTGTKIASATGGFGTVEVSTSVQPPLVSAARNCIESSRPRSSPVA